MLYIKLKLVLYWCDCLQNVTLLINPPAVQRGKNVSLLCLYDLDGAPLYSVKWYRGRYEFYRFSPSEVPPTKIFVFPGIKVDVSQSNASQVVLSDVTFNLAGNISCEVTTDAPGFSTAVAVKSLMVVDLPKNGPTIAVNKSKYDPGDKLIANCSSFPSKPFAVLSFYVNNDLISNQGTKVLPGPDSLSWSFLPVNVTLLPSHFDDHHGVLSLRCTAVISSLYHNTTELRISHRKEPIPEKDERTNNFFLISSPFPVLAILICYVHFVTNRGPRWMKNREPFNLRSIMIVYNIIQILINSFLFVEAFRYGWGGKYSWICEPVDWSDTPLNQYLVRLCYVYFVIKMTDLLDTIFMVLRKKDDHISFLHVYHHTGMCALAWGGVKYLPGGHGTFLGFINTFVHAVMYGYYLFSTIYPENSGKNWWKKYLTQLQMAQFLMVAVHMLILLFQPNCNYPKFTVFVLTPQNIFMFILFCDFYRKTYLKPKPKSQTNGVSKSNGISKNNEKIHLS